jgi:hypothetical protein
MPGFMPGIHALAATRDIDARHKAGHDEMKTAHAGMMPWQSRQQLTP